MRRYTALVWGAVGLSALLALTGCQSPGVQSTSDSDGGDAPITFVTVPISDDPTASNPVKALATLLEQQTGRKVEVIDVPDYMSVVESIRSDHADIALMSAFPSALAVNTGKVDALVAWKGGTEPVSTCVVLKDSPVNDLADLRGKKVAFADPASTSGYFMPVAMLHEAGLEKDKDFESIFAGGHEGSFAALKQGQVDAACTAVQLTKLGAPTFPFAAGEWRTVGESASLPVAGSVLVRPSLDDKTRDLLGTALPKVFSKEHAEELGALKGFVGLETVINPERGFFEPLTEIAAIADVEISDLR